MANLTRETPLSRQGATPTAGYIGAITVAILSPLPAFADSEISRQFIPILGLTTDDHAVVTIRSACLPIHGP